jgi:hypothetical protein
MRNISVHSGPFGSRKEAVDSLWEIVQSKQEEPSLYISFFNGDVLEPIMRYGYFVTGWAIKSDPERFGLKKQCRGVT